MLEESRCTVFLVRILGALALGMLGWAGSALGAESVFVWFVLPTTLRR